VVRQLPRWVIKARRRRDAGSHKHRRRVCDRCHTRGIAECFEKTASSSVRIGFGTGLGMEFGKGTAFSRAVKLAETLRFGS
jgi:hypothetical protein